MGMKANEDTARQAMNALRAEKEAHADTNARLTEDNIRLERERDAARKALRKASVALDDWLNTYAAEFCDDGRVKEAYDRINENGGTIAYIADLRQEIRAILAKAKP